MSRKPRTTPRQRRSQGGAVEDRWRKRVKDEDGRTIEVPSAVAGRVTRWRARYVDNVGREHTRAFERKVDAQRWLDRQLSALLRGDHVAPKDAKLTVGEWCDKWLAGYGARRASTVRQAKVHIKVIKAHFGSVPLSAVRPSDVPAWTALLKDEGRSDSYVYALHSRLRSSSRTPSTKDSWHAIPARGVPHRAWASSVRSARQPNKCGRCTTPCPRACNR